MSPFLLLFLTLSLQIYKTTATNSPKQTLFRTICAPDYEPCVPLRSPKGNLPCCSDDFYCQTHGHYFSQCRPKHHKKQVHKSISISTSKKQPLCAKTNSVCGAGAQPDSKLNCCDKDAVCTPSILIWVCVPKRNNWLLANVQGKLRRVYKDLEWANKYGAVVLPIEDKLKVDQNTQVTQLRMELPKMDNKALQEVVDEVRQRFQGKNMKIKVQFHKVHAVVMVEQGNVYEVANILAQISQVASVQPVSIPTGNSYLQYTLSL